MGRKINPIGFRLAVNRDWKSQWFVRKRFFADCVHQDYEIRREVMRTCAAAMISNIEISRLDNTVDQPLVRKVLIHAARPGVIIGAKGKDIEYLRKRVREITRTQDAIVDVQEIREPDANAALVAQNIAGRLEKRQRSRRVIQSVLQSIARQPSVLGVKIRVKGRLEGADIARKDYRHQGRVPLHTLRADIDYGFAEAHTQMGVIGIKVWIFRGVRPSRGKKPAASLEHLEARETTKDKDAKEAPPVTPAPSEEGDFPDDITEDYEEDVAADETKPDASS